MDLVHQNSSSAGLGICSGLGVLSATESRMPSSYSTGGSPGQNLSMKQCRSTSEVEMDDGGPLKLARKDSFQYRSPSEQQQHVVKLNGGVTASNNNGPAGSTSFSGDNGAGRIACSPTNSCLSDGVLVANDPAANLMGDTRMLRSDPMAATAGSTYNLGAAASMRPYSYQSYQYGGSAGSPLMLAAAAAARGDHLGMQSMRGPFTANQWAELEHQALIFKYMMAGASVPPELLNPIRRSVALNNLTSSHPSLRMGWGNFHLGIPTNPDPEPGRCRRTDGKKWRCSREVVPDQKYCDRHMHRGRNRSKKNAENQAAAAAAAAANSQSGASAVATGGGAQQPSAVGSSGAVQGSSMSQLQNMRPPLGSNGQNQNQSHATGGYCNTSTSKSTNFNQLTSNSNSSSSPSSLQFPMQSLSGASPGGNKDYRYMNGMTRPELNLGSEQLLFSDSPLSWQHQQQQQHFQSRLPRSSNTYPQQQQQQQVRSLSGQHFGMSAEPTQINTLTHQQHHQQHQASLIYGLDQRDVCEEEQPLRHFFDDWPRQRDASTLSWHDLEDDKNDAAGALSTSTTSSTTLSSTVTSTTTTSSGTQLSISLPMSSSDFRVTGSPRGKLSLSPLKLSMSRGEYDEAGDPTRMGLGVGLGISQQHRPWLQHHHHHHQALEGGPLAEVVLQSGTPREHCKNSPAGLNLLGDGWDSSSRETSRMPSPTAVLTKTPFGSFSDSSSNASSPRAVHAEAAALLASKQLI